MLLSAPAPAGVSYEGQLEDGKAKGKGTWYYARGDRHVGKWADHLGQPDTHTQARRRACVARVHARVARVHARACTRKRSTMMQAGREMDGVERRRGGTRARGAGRRLERQREKNDRKPRVTACMRATPCNVLQCNAAQCSAAQASRSPRRCVAVLRGCFRVCVFVFLFQHTVRAPTTTRTRATTSACGKEGCWCRR